MALDILDGYWITNDFNPTTQVFSSAAGVEDYVANNAAAFQAWLTAGNYGFITAVTGTGVGTAGVVRLTVADASLLQSGQRMFVSGVTGTTEANGFFQINQIDATHIDLVGTVFANAWAGGGTIAGAQIYTLASQLWQAFDRYAQQAYRGSSLSVTQAANYAVTSPMPSDLTVTFTAANHNVTLPKMRTPRAPPIGRPFTIRNGAVYPPLGAHPGAYIHLLRNDGVFIGDILGNRELTFQLQANDTAAGTIIAPPSPAKAASYSAGLFVDSTGTTQLSINCHEVLMHDGNGDQLYILMGGGGVFANAGIAGPIAGGRDQAAAFGATDEIYAYLIAGKATAPNGLLSGSFPPTLPTGYTHYCMIGTYKLLAGVFAALWQRGGWVYFKQPKLCLNGGNNTAGYGGLGGVGQVLFDTLTCQIPNLSGDYVIDIEKFQITADGAGVINATLGISIDGINTAASRLFVDNGAAATAKATSSGEFRSSSYINAGAQRFWYNVTVTTGSAPLVNIRARGYNCFGVLSSP